MENKIRKAFDALSADRQLKETTKVFYPEKEKRKQSSYIIRRFKEYLQLLVPHCS